jgi:pilus assembly protein CpaB
MSFAQRVQRNPVLLLAVGSVLIAAAAILVWLNVRERGADVGSAAQTAGQTSSAQASMESVLVASHAIARGAVIGADDVMLRGVAAPAPSDSIADPAVAIGRVATDDILPSQIIFGGMLSASKVAAGVAALVQPGQRAFSVKVTEDQIVGGFLRVADRVDVFVSLPGSVYSQSLTAGGRDADQSRATMLLQNVAVLAVGEKLSTSGPEALSGARTVTLAITPDAVARLALADRLGKVLLAIRNPADKDMAGASSIGLADLGAAPVEASPEIAVAPAGERKATGHRIIIYSGAATTSVTTPR